MQLTNVNPTVNDVIEDAVVSDTRLEEDDGDEYIETSREALYDWTALADGENASLADVVEELEETKKEMAERTYALDREYVKREAAEEEVIRLRNKLARAEMEIQKLKNTQSSDSQELGSLPTSADRLGVCACSLAPALNCDFRNVDDTGLRFEVGGMAYVRPIGCESFALKGSGKYDGGDAWMMNWWNAYSGTSMANAREIVRNGFHLGKAERSAYGEGIYCTPDPETAKEYARQKGAFCHNGASYLVVVQVRVDPSKCKLVKPAGQGPLADGEYWTLPDNDSIRPYAICLYKI